MAILAVNSQWVAALIAIGVFSLSITVTIMVGITYRQLAAPDDLRSSVNVIGRMTAWGGQPFGAATGASLLHCRCAHRLRSGVWGDVDLRGRRCHRAAIIARHR